MRYALLAKKMAQGGCDRDQGFDYELVDEVSDELICSICLQLLRSPKLTSCCGHRYCSTCINRVQQKKMPCPLCQSGSFTLLLDKLYVRKVNSLRVKCPNAKLGCGWRGDLGKAEEHKKSCKAMAVPCCFSHMGCKATVAAREMEDHLSATSGAHLAMVLQAVQGKDKQIADLERKVSSLQSEVGTLQNSMKKLSMEIPRKYPPLDLVMCDYDSYKSAENEWVSDGFYTHPGGYKMCLVVYANGMGRGRDTHVSVFATLMCGENDDRLIWPFRGHVHVELLDIPSEDDPDDDMEVDGVFKFNSRTPARTTARPLGVERNQYGHGDPEFVEHDEIPISVDNLLFRVTRVTFP